MTVGQWEDAFIGDNVSLVRPWNVDAARAALRFLETFEMVPDNAPTYLGISPTIDKVPNADGE